MATALNSGSNCNAPMVSTVVEPANPRFNHEEQVGLSSGVVRLKLSKAEDRKKVSWTNDTVDNENLGKKKSKCCCVYVRPKTFDESSSDESEGECEHCSGHVKKKHAPPSHSKNNDPPPSNSS